MPVSKEAVSACRQAREIKDITMMRLAELADIDNGHLSRIERGMASCSPDVAERIVKVLGRDLIHEMHLLYPERLKKKRGSLPLTVTHGGGTYILVGA